MIQPLSFLLALSMIANVPARPPWSDGRMIRERRPAHLPAQDLSRFKEQLLDSHNRERKAFGAAPLQWDDGLAAAAAAYGPYLSAQGKLTHSAHETRPGQGENLWMGTRGAFGLDEMTGGWLGERILFRPGIFPNVSSTGHWSDVAHYTQMIWRGSNRVGCALKTDTKWDFLICRYYPAGNVVGQKVP
jgi:hypothetical protein